MQCQLALAEIALQERYVSESHDWLARAERFASQAGWQEVLVRAALLQGRNHLVRGDPVAAREELARGAGAAERFGFGILAADLLIALGEADLERDPAGAERVGREGLRRAEAYGYVWGVNAGLRLVSRALGRRGDEREARRFRARAAKFGRGLRLANADDSPVPGGRRPRIRRRRTGEDGD